MWWLGASSTSTQNAPCFPLPQANKARALEEELRVICGMMLGPVSSAAHSTPTIGGALFPIGIGLAPLIYVWVRFFRADNEQPKPSMENMIGISLVLCAMIADGIWELMRALKISN
jgi:hypothetical protein